MSCENGTSYWAGRPDGFVNRGTGHWRPDGRITDYPEVTPLATTQELNEDLYLRRSYLTLFLNGTGYQESKLEA